jgi:hypothetical protein
MDNVSLRRERDLCSLSCDHFSMMVMCVSIVKTPMSLSGDCL